MPEDCNWCLLYVILPSEILSKKGDSMMSENSMITSLKVMFVLFIFVQKICPKYLTYGRNLDEAVHLKLIKIENETENQDFVLFNGFDPASAFVSAHSEFNFDMGKEIGLSSQYCLTVKCCKGSYVPVFVQDGGCVASGSVDQGFEGPFFLSMWLSIPNAAESNKIRVRYQVKKDSVGKVGLRIGKNGDYRFVAYENVKFIES